MRLESRRRFGGNNRSAARPALQDADEFIGLKRFDEVFVGADLHGVVLVGGVAADGGDDDLRLNDRGA